MEKSEHDLMAELHFYRDCAEMRATCDFCGAKRVLVALSQHDSWSCFECSRKIKEASHDDK